MKNCIADVLHVIIAGNQTLKTEDCFNVSSVSERGQLGSLYLETDSMLISFGYYFYYKESNFFNKIITENGYGIFTLKSQ